MTVRQVSVAAAALAVAAATGCFRPSDSDPDAARASRPSTPAAAALVQFTNEARERAGLPALGMDTALERAAQIQAEQVAAAGRLEHTVTGAAYPRLEERLAAAGYQWRLVGENLASGQISAAAAVETWMQSPPHRANILNADFVESGAAQVVDRSGRPYYVQVFAQPAP